MRRQASSARRSKTRLRSTTTTSLAGGGSTRSARISKRATMLPLSPALRAQQARELGKRLRPHLSGDLRLTITDNRSVMISVQRDPRHHHYKVRLHHLFVDAPDRVLAALGRYISHNDRQASQQLNAFIEGCQDRIRPPQPRITSHAPVRTKGRFFDIQAIFDDLNKRYFDQKVRCTITWGRLVNSGKPRRTIKVGSYILEHNLIRIHPGLDQEWIPLFYIQWVIFHEMLHVVHPINTVNGRRRFHTNAFARDEQRFEDYDRAIIWEKRNVAALLCI